MKPARKKKLADLDRASGVHKKALIQKKGERTRKIGDVTLKEVFPYATDKAFEKVDEALEAAREKLGVVLSTNGQLIMFPGYNDEKKEIPAEKAKEFEAYMRRELSKNNIQVTRNGMEVLLNMGGTDDPAEDQGHRRG